MLTRLLDLLPDSVAAALSKAAPAIRPAVMTAVFTFVGIFATSLVGFLQDVSGWLSTYVESPEAAEFPDPSVLGQAALAGITAALAGLTNFVIRWVQSAKSWGNPPTYQA